VKCVFLGSKTLGLRILEAVINACPTEWRIVHPDDHQDARSTIDAFNDFAKERQIDLLVAPSASTAKAIISDYKPDIALVCGWYWSVDAETLASVPMGVYGIHNSLLPKYRGGAPLVWSIINGEQHVGSTVFKMTPEMDAGDILMQVTVWNQPEKTVGVLLAEIEKELVQRLPARWSSVMKGVPPLLRQNHDEATHCGQRRPEDGLIDWDRPATAVHDFIRAQSAPYPGAFSWLSTKKIIIARSAVDSRRWIGTPGQILDRSGSSVAIACRNSAILVLDVLVDGIPAFPHDVLTSVKMRLSKVATP
jgi:methionyl-tRNA formyltransferase